MIVTLLAAYGWIIALILGAALYSSDRKLNAALQRETEYLNRGPSPSLAAMKAARSYHVQKGARIIAPLLLLFAWPSSSEAQRLIVPASAFVAVQAMDLHSTHVALSRGAIEGNPLMQSHRALYKVAATAGAVYLAHRINRSHPRVARLTLWIPTVIVGAVAVHNYRLGVNR